MRFPDSHSASEIQRVWKDYYSKEERTLFGRLIQLFRHAIVSRSLRYWFDRVFPESGLFVEAGAGTSQASGRVRLHNRTLIALDAVDIVIHKLNVLDLRVQGDIAYLPFGDRSLTGIWNLGVMEHYTDNQLRIILSEFRRVLKPTGRLLMFWPPWYAPHEIVLNSMSRLAWALFGKKLVFFPDEVNRYSTRRRMSGLLASAGFQVIETRLSWRDLFCYVVVVAAPTGHMGT